MGLDDNFQSMTPTQQVAFVSNLVIGFILVLVGFNKILRSVKNISIFPTLNKNCGIMFYIILGGWLIGINFGAWV